MDPANIQEERSDRPRPPCLKEKLLSDRPDQHQGVQPPAQPLHAVRLGLAQPMAKGWSPAPHGSHGREAAAAQSAGDLGKIQVKSTQVPGEARLETLGYWGLWGFQGRLGTST